MKRILKLEELAMWLLSIIVLLYLEVDWWWYIIMVIGPDVSMVGYFLGNKFGAFLYNLFHHKGIAIFLLIMSMISGIPHVFNFSLDDNTSTIVAIILFGHSSMDRFFGYGLKYENGFKFTHLGEIGKK